MTIQAAYDFYWRFDQYDHLSQSDLISTLITAGCSATIALESKPELIARKVRLDRGLLLYENCTDEELQQLVRRRLLQPMESAYKACGLPRHDIVDLRKWWHDGMIKKLEDADATGFGKFLDLPPELRSRVYKFYVGSLPAVLSCPSQPPLARTCNLIRNEVLPIFYGHHTFELRYTHPGRGWAHIRPMTHIRPTIDTRLFLHSIPIGQVANLRHLRIGFSTLEFPSELGILQAGSIMFNVNLSRPAGNSKCTLTASTKNLSTHAMLKHLEQMLKKTEESDGRKTFRMSDIKAIGTALEEGWAERHKPV
ncbi:hypothetical protein BDY17DRAFT_327240 [Neohortaea acidophila]|uniref:Uncharacterized protein n=1 Tax=Neohortaea acidophila TaxID=245834 RepID=A0A6A6PKF0_9PEZI|nr:uncharacterized protein BDY17DRAFT_327240 [Neohortaea acidophila]KAF2480276.1 hypothetical protein BDY17DRAFT_327240 [Neohortaea acidophila]